MSTTAAQRTRTIVEGGYKIVPGKEVGFFEDYNKMVPIAMKQDGFQSVFGGPILREAKLNAAEIQSLREALAGVAEAGAEPFETLTGDFEPQPYQFTGPVGIAPKVDGLLYALVTHWSSPEKCHAWQESASYLALERLGKVTSEVFMPLPEAYPRDRLREDKLQRQWTLAGTTESAQFAKASAQTAVGRNER